MKYNSKLRELSIENKTLNFLDKFMLDFAKTIKKHSGYVIVSGYVSILLGRSRASEDIDLLIPKMNITDFKLLFEDLLKNGFECLNTSIADEAYEMWHEHAIRFAKSMMAVPNIEFKIIDKDIQENAFKNRVKVVLGKDILYISSLELQIPYKLSLMSDSDIQDISSDKDFEDAKHLYNYFKEDLDMEKLLYFVKLLNVEKKFEFLEKWKKI